MEAIDGAKKVTAASRDDPSSDSFQSAQSLRVALSRNVRRLDGSAEFCPMIGSNPALFSLKFGLLTQFFVTNSN